MSAAQPPIKGLPEGVDPNAKIGVAGPDDYEIIDGEIFKGERPGASSGVLVKPLPGYSFSPARGHFDIRAFQLVPESPGSTRQVIVKNTPTVNVKAELVFTVNNDVDHANVLAALKQLEGLPGFVETQLS